MGRFFLPAGRIEVGLLLHDAFFEIFCEVRADFGGGAFGSDLCNIMLNHELDKLLKAGLRRVPAQLGLGLRRVTPEVDDVGGTVEVGGNADDDLSN